MDYSSTNIPSKTYEGKVNFSYETGKYLLKKCHKAIFFGWKGLKCGIRREYKVFGKILFTKLRRLEFGMKLRLGKKNSAMMTVELGVSLVLIVVVLFVVIGLFNDNIKSMIGSSNFARLFSANGLKTFFQSFNRNYDDSQIYVQIMGEQGLQMLRKKANNNDLSLLDAAKITGAATNPRTANTILYLAQVINILVGNQEVCAKMTDLPNPASATCSALSLGVKYTVSGGGTLLTITDSSGATLKLTLSKSFDTPTISANANAKDKLAAIQQLAAQYGANIDSSYAMTREINNFASIVSGGNGQTTIEQEIIALLGSSAGAKSESLYTYLAANANKDCNPPYDPTTGMAKPGCQPSYVTSSDLTDYSTLVSQLATQFNTLLFTQTTITNDKALLPSNALPPAYKPTINSDDNWYSANAADTDIIEGSEDALILTKNDPLSLLAPKGEDPIFQGSSDAIINCKDGDTSCTSCQNGGGTYTGTGVCTCPTGETWSGTSCVQSSTQAPDIVACSGNVYCESCQESGGTWDTSSNACTCPQDTSFRGLEGCTAYINATLDPTLSDMNDCSAASGTWYDIGGVGNCFVCKNPLYPFLGLNGSTNICYYGQSQTGGGGSSTISIAAYTCSKTGTSITCYNSGGAQTVDTITLKSDITANPVSLTYYTKINPTTHPIAATFDGGFVSGTKYTLDPYMSKLAGTTEADMARRIALFTIYNDLIRALQTQTIKRTDGTSWTIGKFLSRDQKEGTCDKYKTGMMAIASKYGVSGMYDYYNNSTSTLCK